MGTASDNLNAAVAGGLGAVQDLLSKYITGKFNLENEDLLAGRNSNRALAQKKALMPLEWEQKQRELNLENQNRLGQISATGSVAQQTEAAKESLPVTYRNPVNPSDIIGHGKKSDKFGEQQNTGNKANNISSLDIKKIQEYDDLIKDYGNIVTMAKQVKPSINPTLAAVPGWAEKIFRTKEGNVFTAESDKVFQKFRSKTTGANASLRELSWLVNDVPNINDKNLDTFVSKGDYALSEIKKERNSYLNNLKSANKDVSKFEMSSDSSDQNQSLPTTSIPSKTSGTTKRGLTFTVEE